MTSCTLVHRQPTCYEIERLIQEVQNRPAIWNKNYDGYTDRRLKSRMWEEVCESIIDDWKQLKALEKHKLSCEIQKKWKNVKDSFKKELHIEKKILAGQTKRKKKKYIHYDALSFLASAELCTAETVSLDDSDEESDSGSAEQETSNTSTRKRRKKYNAEENESGLRIKRELYNYDEEASNGDLNMQDSDQNNDNFPEIELENAKYGNNKFQNRPNYPDAHFVEIPCENWDNEDNSQIGINRTLKKKRGPYVRRQTKVYDEDISFTEMVVPMLRKLTEDQKHYAKIEIMNIIHKAKRYYPACSSGTQTDKLVSTTETQTDDVNCSSDIKVAEVTSEANNQI